VFGVLRPNLIQSNLTVCPEPLCGIPTLSKHEVNSCKAPAPLRPFPQVLRKNRENVVLIIFGG
jgi:hypothetical protein